MRHPNDSSQQSATSTGWRPAQITYPQPHQQHQPQPHHTGNTMSDGLDELYQVSPSAPTPSPPSSAHHAPSRNQDRFSGVGSR